MILQRFRYSILAGTRIDLLTRANILQPRSGLSVKIDSALASAQPIAPIDGTIHELLEY
ncbi:MAG: hypothetical protein AAF702_18080 [Chloroflexota bacterium]